MVYEINTEVWLREQTWSSANGSDLADIPDGLIEEWARMGIDIVWFLGVWKTGAASRRICLDNEGLRASFEQALPGAVPNHVVGSPFSIVDYSLRPEFGDETTLLRLREKLHAHGIRLMLDFVPNHLAVDHPWVQKHPERFVRGAEVMMEREPHNYFRVPGNPSRILAHGRDPYFPGWTDTAQVNIFSAETRRALTEMLLAVSDVCDAVRCDMAMLLVNNVFKRTWGDLSIKEYPSGDPSEFWVEAIAAVKQRHPDFVFLAEVYWGLEREMQEMGFDYTYDKNLYDCLRAGDGAGARNLLRAPKEFQTKLVRFIENHDESRAASVFGTRQEAVATLISALPGLVLYHEGQFDGRRVHVPVQLGARPQEVVDETVSRFYERLLAIAREPVMREGEFQPLAVREAWRENATFHVIVTYWRSLGDQSRLVVANIGEHQAQSYTSVPLNGFSCPVLEFRDLTGEACYYRSRNGLARKGLYLDIAGGAYHIFRVQPAPPGREPDPYSE
jgi:hypothetical protein